MGILTQLIAKKKKGKNRASKEIERTWVHVQNEAYLGNIKEAKIVINRGGTRSSKTMSLMLMWVALSFTKKNYKILVSRYESPALTVSALADFRDEIMRKMDFGKYFREHKTEHYFENRQTGTKIYFLACKDQQKVKGVKWDIVHLNEADEIPYDVFRQLIMRLSAQIYLDFNPSSEDVWINNHLEKGAREDVKVIISSYLDNPFLSPEIVKEIEAIRLTDEYWWHVYGKGEYGVLPNRIWRNVKICTNKEFDSLGVSQCDCFLGMDIGDAVPTALIYFKMYKGRVYGKEIFYQKAPDYEDVINVLKKYKIQSWMSIYVDSAAPAWIRTLRKYGYKAQKAYKTDFEDAVFFINNTELYITASSKNYWFENRNYDYEVDHNNRVVSPPRPQKKDDHLQDAKRYGIYTHLRRKILSNAIS